MKKKIITPKNIKFKSGENFELNFDLITSNYVNIKELKHKEQGCLCNGGFSFFYCSFSIV